MQNEFTKLMIEHCSPALAGVKPANMFHCNVSDVGRLCSEVSYWNRELMKYGIRVRIMKGCCKSREFLIYVYRVEWLKSILKLKSVTEFLSFEGYSIDIGGDEILRQLSKRLCLKKDFPHEIGVFLGYPLYDVKKFIEHKGRNYTFCGCWKAYGDPKTAKKNNDMYKKCTEVYKRLFANGTPIEKLVVAA